MWFVIDMILVVFEMKLDYPVRSRYRGSISGIRDMLDKRLWLPRTSHITVRVG